MRVSSEVCSCARMIQGAGVGAARLRVSRAVQRVRQSPMEGAPFMARKRKTLPKRPPARRYALQELKSLAAMNSRGREEMKRLFNARSVLVADGLGCAAAASAVLGSELVASSIDRTLKSRQIVGIALGATSATLLAGAVRARGSDLALSAAINVAWIGVCLVALSRRPAGPGVALIAATAVFDGAAATAQWRLRSTTATPNVPDRTV